MRIDINIKLMERTDDNAGIQPYYLYDATDFAIRHELIKNKITLSLMNCPNTNIMLNERFYAMSLWYHTTSPEGTCVRSH